MLTNAHVGEGGGKKDRKCAHVINVRPLFEILWVKTIFRTRQLKILTTPPLREMTKNLLKRNLYYRFFFHGNSFAAYPLTSA